MHRVNTGSIRAQLTPAYSGFPDSSPFTRPFSSIRGDVAPLLVRPFSSVAGTGGESASPFVGAGAAGVSGSVGTGIAYYFRRNFVRAQIAFAKVVVFLGSKCHYRKCVAFVCEVLTGAECNKFTPRSQSLILGFRMAL